MKSLGGESSRVESSRVICAKFRSDIFSPLHFLRFPPTQTPNHNHNNDHNHNHNRVTPAYRDRVAADSQVEFERLVGSAKHPLRIDIRHNDANPVVLEGTLESAMLNPSLAKDASHYQFGTSGAANNAIDYTEDPNELATGKWSASGLIDTVRKQSQAGASSSRPQSAAMTRRANQLQSSPGVGGENQTRPPARPQSAIVGGRTDRSQSPAIEHKSMGMGVSIGSRALMRPPPAGHRGGGGGGRGGSDEDDEDEDRSLSTPRSARGRQAGGDEHRGLIAMIESGSKASRSAAGGGGGGMGDAVGSLLDESIRQIQEVDGIAPSSASKKGKKKKKSVNETILTDTKRVYVNKMHFPGEEEALAVIEARKRSAQAALSAGGGGGHRDRDDKKRPASATMSTQSEARGGGAVSAMAASAVRNRLAAAKEQESKLSGSGRPGSDSVKNSASKKSAAHSLLHGIQKLNPATLF